MSELETDVYAYLLKHGKHRRSKEELELFTPTDAVPGSPEKIEIMRKRIEMGFSAFHPLDRTDLKGIRSEQSS